MNAPPPATGRKVILADTGHQPDGGKLTVDLSAAEDELRVEWIHPIKRGRHTCDSHPRWDATELEGTISW